MEINYDEIGKTFESFRDYAACIKYVEPKIDFDNPNDASQNSKLTVIRDTGKITGDCSGKVANTIGTLLYDWGFVLVNHWAGANELNELEAYYLHPDKVEAISRGWSDKVKVKFNGVSEPIEMPTYLSSYQIYDLLTSRRMNNLEPIRHL